MSYSLRGFMDRLHISVLAELCLAFGIAGLLWPAKFIAVFDVLMFPWGATYRLVRAHSIVALGAALLLLSSLLAGQI